MIYNFLHNKVLTLLFGFILAAQSLFAQTTIRVIDAEDSGPVPYATVFSKSGSIVGLTDNDGVLSIGHGDYFPLTIKCMGYEPLECAGGTTTAALKHSVYPLKEVVVTPVDRPVIHVICYIREYVSGESGPEATIMYNEHMGDFFVGDGKLKGFKTNDKPRFLTSRLRARVTNSEQNLDSIFVPEFRNDMVSWEQLIEFPKRRVEIKTGKKSGEFGIRETVTRAGELTTIRTDFLADEKNHRMSPLLFKLIGFSMDITTLQRTMIVSPSGGSSYNGADIRSATFTFDATATGKWIKKAFHTDSPVHMYAYFEVYPVEVEYLTIEQAKNLQKNPPRVKMQVSPLAPAPDAAARQMMERCGK